MTDGAVRGQLSRRTLAGLAASAGLGVPLLAACGKSGSAVDRSGTLGSTSDIEVGGGTVFADQQVVVTQPKKGEFKAFDSTCTHQGCQVESVSAGTINCPCHGSRFSIEDGSPESGPATSPLGEVKITVTGGEITLA